MNWDDLRHFLAAYRHCSLAGAGRELGCEYTTVRRRIDALETALGTTLFIRTPEGLVPTKAAHDLLPHAVQIEQSANAIATTAANQDQRLEGVVRITTPEGFSAYVVDQLAALKARHADLSIEILADIRPLDLARGEADLALRMGPTKQAELVARTLCTLPWRMFASVDYLERRGSPDPVTDLRGHDVVGYSDALAHVPGAQWLAERTGANVLFRGSSLRGVIDAVGAGLGLSVLPHFMASREHRLQVVAPDVLGSRTLTIVVHPDLSSVARVRVVMDFLVEAVLRDHACGVFG